MRSNINQHQYHYNSTTSSSIFTHHSPQPYNLGIQKNNQRDQYLKPYDNKIEGFNLNAYQRNVSSQSMIASNQSDIGKRKTFGLLDGMARKVTTNFKDDQVGEVKSVKETNSEITTASSIDVNNKASVQNKFLFKREDITNKNNEE